MTEKYAREQFHVGDKVRYVGSYYDSGVDVGTVDCIYDRVCPANDPDPSQRELIMVNFGDTLACFSEELEHA